MANLSDMTTEQLRALKKFRAAGGDLTQLSTEDLQNLQTAMPSTPDLSIPQQAVQGLTTGIGSALDIPFRVGATLANPLLGAAGVPGEYHINPQAATGAMSQAGLTVGPQSTLTGRVSEMAGGAFPVAGGLMAAGARQGAAPALQAAAQSPGRFLAAEGLAAGGAGVGAHVGAEMGGPTGEAIGTLAGGFVPAAATGAARTALGGPDLSSTLAEFEAVGATPSAGEAGAITSSMLESTVERFPGGIVPMRAHAQRNTDALGRRVDELVSLSGTPKGSTLTGEDIQEGTTNWVKSRWNPRVERLYADLGEKLGSDPRVTPTNTLRVLTDLNTPTPGAEATSSLSINPRISEWMKAVAADAEAGGGSIPYDAMRRVRSDIGRIISSPQLHTSEPIAELKRVYGALSEDLKAAASAQGPEALKAFNRANNAYRDGVEFIEKHLVPIHKAKTGERVYKALTSSLKSGQTMVRNLRKTLSREQFNEVRAEVLREMGQATPGVQGAEGDRFSVNTFLTNWNRMDPGAKNVLFGQAKNSSFRRDLDQVARVSERIKDSAAVLANPSGTGQTLASIAMTGGVVGGITQMNPSIVMAALSPAVATYGMGKLMTSPKFVRWLASTTRKPVTQLPEQIDQLTKIAEPDEETQAALDQYILELQRTYLESLPTPQPSIAGIRSGQP